MSEAEKDYTFCGFNTPLMFRLKGTVLLRIKWQILFIILYSTIVIALHTFVNALRMDFPHSLIPILTVVIGLLLVFRTNTAYDRYWEGRRLWSQMTLNIRTLTRCIWVGVTDSDGTAKDIVEKTSAINLLVAFAYATKNYLREEYSYETKELKELIGHIPRFAPASQRRCGLKLNPTPTQTTKPGPNTENDEWFKDNQFNPLMAHDYVPPTNIPIQLSYYIASYINSVRVRGLCDPSTIALMNNSLTSLVDCLTGFERILRTPIPLAYSVHLNHSIWLYLLALPYQLAGALGWWTIPAVTLASFSLLGILGIGWEIENPFGYDDNDLPLDNFCEVIRQEIQVIIGHGICSPEAWMLHPENRPFSPTSNLTATELSTKSVEEVRNITSKWALGTNMPPNKSGLKLPGELLSVVTTGNGIGRGRGRNNPTFAA